VAEVLSREDEIRLVAVEAAQRRVYAIGAGPNEATALEAVIKVREAAQGWIDALAAEQFLHGPLIAVNADDVAVIVNVRGAAAGERLAEITRVLDGVGAHVWLIGAPIEGLQARPRLFELPPVPEVLSPLLAVVPVHEVLMSRRWHMNPRHQSETLPCAHARRRDEGSAASPVDPRD
jgi:glutamine---fructose-6-phosphate transaminase (isomerizing)